jgi:hypothetical protein
MACGRVWSAGSSCPTIAAKLKEIVGLYVNPHNHAIVLSVDEKRFHGD